jgi:hypothetical protein
LSDFDLGDMPHQVINAVADGVFDLLNASERQLCQYFEITRGMLR